MARFLDIVFFFYFLTHIPISLLVDFQSVLPLEYYPQQLIDVKEWYCREFRDPMMVAAPTWFKSFVFCELLIQFPFFFIAVYGFFKGSKNCKWLRWPCVVYGSHVATTLIPISAHILFYDFSNEKHPSPRNLNERLTLLGFYFPYLLVPVLLVLDSLFSSSYRTSSTQQSSTKQQPANKTASPQQQKKKKVK
ncbi:sigma intracellular receptor 2-like [Physella acuta]|uniref:sigma intracellular receptor 2-like n=1 Tax=Physella acuta TaxID=109671 RepID=UPI0027DD0D3E|nr:sigma intracellular receptor 2-like [Physella acuta]